MIDENPNLTLVFDEIKHRDEPIIMTDTLIHVWLDTTIVFVLSYKSAPVIPLEGKFLIPFSK